MNKPNVDANTLDQDTIVRWGLLATEEDNFDPLLYKVLDQLEAANTQSKVQHAATLKALEALKTSTDSVNRAISQLTSALLDAKAQQPKYAHSKPQRRRSKSNGKTPVAAQQSVSEQGSVECDECL